jgi:hypothetical protein
MAYYNIRVNITFWLVRCVHSFKRARRFLSSKPGYISLGAAYTRRVGRSIITPRRETRAPKSSIDPRITALIPLVASIPSSAQTTTNEKGWLVIHGGGNIANEVKERFMALAGGPNARIVMIPSAMTDAEIPGRSIGIAKAFGV